MNPTTLENYWQQFLAALPPDSPIRDNAYDSCHFGDNPAMADALAALIVAGTKTATCYAWWEWEEEDEAITELGQKTIVLDGNDQPCCIIETTAVSLRNYNEVDAAFAAAEGEGDLSLDYWRAEHWSFFTRSLPKIGKVPALDMPLVCEHFRVIYL